MAKTTFAPGVVISSAFLNAINNPVFDGADLDGHYPPITNADLDTNSGSILSEWNAFKDNFLVTADSGTTVIVSAGSLLTPTGSTLSLPLTSVALPDNTNSYVYVDTDGIVSYSSELPGISYLLALVTTSSGTVSNITDLREDSYVKPLTSLNYSFGGLGGEGPKTINVLTDITGDKYYKNFTLNTGVTATAEGYSHLYVAGSVLIEGTITVNPIVPGGDGYLGSMACPGQITSNKGSGLSGGNNFTGSQPASYDYRLSSLGSGGASGFVRGSLQNPGATYPTDAGFNNSIQVEDGGKGGGCLIIEASGPIVINNAIINCQGGDANNVTQPTTSLQQYIIISGSGGGSGGLIWLKSKDSITINNSTTLSVQGGNGGTGHITSNRLADFVAKGGGGGSGGYIILQAPIVEEGLATIAINGGSGAVDTGGTSNQFATIEGGGGGAYGGLGGSSGLAGATGSFQKITNHIPV